MRERQRTITKATVTVTFDLYELGTFGEGSLVEQAKHAAAFRLAALLQIPVSPECIQVASVESASENGYTGKVEVVGSGSAPQATCRQRLAAEGKPYPRSSCAICGAFSPAWKECDAAISLEGMVNGLLRP